MISRRHKVLALFLILALSTPLLITVIPVSAQKDTPWIPQYSVKLGSASNVSPGLIENTQSIENYTTVELVIVNQPLASTYYQSNPMDYQGVGFYYNIRITTPQEPNSWKELYSAKTEYLRPTNGSNTIVPIPVKGNGTISIQVEAMIGHTAEGQDYTSNGWVDTGNYYFMGTFSGWSSNQTAALSDTITYTAPPPTATPTSSNVNSGLPLESVLTVAVTLAILLVVAATVMILSRHPRNPKV
jgi:hypothetical protein